MDVRLVGWIALGGALGAVLRYLVASLFSSPSFPFATLLVNVVGSFTLAFLLFLHGQSPFLTPGLRAFFGIGLLGAFTTMSAVGHETIALYDAGRPLHAALVALLNITASVAAAGLGWAAAHGFAEPTA